MTGPGGCIPLGNVYDRWVETERSLTDDIQRIRDRLRAMRTEREAAMHHLTESREHAEAQRQVRADALPPSPITDPPPVHAP